MSANPNGNGNGHRVPPGVMLSSNWQQDLAEEYEKTLSLTAACRKAGISRQTYCKYLKTDPQFAEMIDNAYNAAKDRLQASAFERAINGTESVREFYVTEQKRMAVTLMAQQLLDNGWTLKLALSHMMQLGIPAEDVKLIRGEDLKNVNGNGDE
jgi:hypothetical protein